MITTSSSLVKDIAITGNKPLSGVVTTNSAKNSTVAVIAASLINQGTTTLYNVSRISDVHQLLEAAESLGVNIDWVDNKTVKISPPERLKINNLDRKAILRGGRSTILFLGALANQNTNFTWPHAGGCKMGERTIIAHKHSLNDLGIKISTTEYEYVINADDKKAGSTTLYESSDTATENILIAAATLPGKTTIHFAQSNYMVQEVCFYLQELGIKIDSIGTSTIEITGNSQIGKDVEYHIAEDPIESMMFISAAGATNSQLKINRCPIDFLRRELLILQSMGLLFDISDDYLSTNNKTIFLDITVYPSDLKAPDVKIHAQPYPGINTDNLPFFVPLATQAEGLTLIHDWMWENRAIYFTELNRLGADVRLADPHRVFISGKSELRSARVVCPPALRPSMIILVTMLAAEGRSVLHSVHPLNRGYENIFERLKEIGADIEIVDSE